MQALEHLLDRAVRRGSMEVHAFTVLTTHCHLLVRCPRERLTGALRSVYGPLARCINRRLKREGSLFANQGCIAPVRTAAHWRAVITYIDLNAVEAGLATRSARYPFCSAWHYARPAGPRWLRRDVVEEFVRRRVEAEQYEPTDYTRVFGPRGRGLAEFAERRAKLSPQEIDPLDDLLDAAPIGVRRWLENRARVADGVVSKSCLVGPSALLASLDRERRRTGTWAPMFDARRPGRRVDGWRTLAAGLLRTSAGLGLAEIAQELRISTSGAHVHVQRHSVLMRDDPAYSSRAERVLSNALRASFD